MKRPTNHEEWLEWEKGSAERLIKWTEEHAIRYKKAFNDQEVNWEKQIIVQLILYLKSNIKSNFIFYVKLVTHGITGED